MADIRKRLAHRVYIYFDKMQVARAIVKSCFAKVVRLPPNRIFRCVNAMQNKYEYDNGEYLYLIIRQFGTIHISSHRTTLCRRHYGYIYCNEYAISRNHNTERHIYCTITGTFCTKNNASNHTNIPILRQLFNNWYKYHPIDITNKLIECINITDIDGCMYDLLMNNIDNLINYYSKMMIILYTDDIHRHKFEIVVRCIIFIIFIGCSEKRKTLFYLPKMGELFAQRIARMCGHSNENLEIELYFANIFKNKCGETYVDLMFRAPICDRFKYSLTKFLQSHSAECLIVPDKYAKYTRAVTKK